jgi:hypothetical protein
MHGHNIAASKLKMMWRVTFKDWKRIGEPGSVVVRVVT